MNLKPIRKFKDKDLLGPLKYLDKTESCADISLEKTETGSETSKNKNESETHKNNSERTLSTKEVFFETETQPIIAENLFGLPLVVERKSYQRNIRFHVKPNGSLKVVAPKNRSLDIIKLELSEYKDWILKCNQEFQKVRDKFPLKVFKTGCPFHFLGECFELKLQSADLKKPMLELDLDQLSYFYPESWDLISLNEKQGLLKKHLMLFYKEKAIFYLNQRLRLLSDQTGLRLKKISYRNQRTRWGSCSTDGSMSLNWKLIVFYPDIIDYVIIHELCHLKHANHGTRFWKLVESFCPDYKRLKKDLSNSQYLADFLAPESELYLCNPSLVE